MPHTRSTTPAWHRPTLRTKRNSHAACFADILGKPEHELSEGKFEILSEDCYEKHWLRYEADCREKDTREYVGVRHYCVDDMLGVAVTTPDEARFVTYFHEDFDQRHGVRPPRNATLGQRQLEYRLQLKRDQDTTKMRDLKILPNR